MVKMKFSRKGFYIIIFFIVVSFLFFSFLYLPKARQLRKLGQWLKTVQPELKDIEGVSSKGVSLSEFIGGLEATVKFLNDTFP